MTVRDLYLTRARMHYRIASRALFLLRREGRPPADIRSAEELVLHTIDAIWREQERVRAHQEALR